MSCCIADDLFEPLADDLLQALGGVGPAFTNVSGRHPSYESTIDVSIDIRGIGYQISDLSLAKANHLLASSLVRFCDESRIRDSLGVHNKHL